MSIASASQAAPQQSATRNENSERKRRKKIVEFANCGSANCGSASFVGLFLRLVCQTTQMSHSRVKLKPT